MPKIFIFAATKAQLAELVDALVSGTSIRKDVKVRVLYWAQKPIIKHCISMCYGWFFFLNPQNSTPCFFITKPTIASSRSVNARVPFFFIEKAVVSSSCIFPLCTL